MSYWRYRNSLRSPAQEGKAAGGLLSQPEGEQGLLADHSKSVSYSTESELKHCKEAVEESGDREVQARDAGMPKG